MNDKGARELAYSDWKRGMKPKQLSEKYGVSINTVKSWIARNWKKKETATIERRPEDARVEKRGLTEEEQRFCALFLTDFNAAQAYLKVYGGKYEAARVKGPELLVNADINEEIKRLKETKSAALGNLSGEDVLDLHMRIAFANMNDFVEFGDDKETGHSKHGENALPQTVSELRLKDGHMVDGQIVTEFSVGRGGMKVKLADRQKSLQFLERYFSLNPSDRHKNEYEQMKSAFESGDVRVNITIGDEEF